MLVAMPGAAQSGKPGAHHKAQKPQAQAKKQNAPMRGKLEKLSCKLGTEDRQARIAVELIGGRLKSLAYYSKWKPRTCSVYIVRDDAYSKWEDTAGVTVVTLNEEKGAFLIDYSRTAVKFLFREIDRERFCGMPGKITGSLTVTRGRDQCELEGVMDEKMQEPVKDMTAEPPVVPQKAQAKEVPKEAPKEIVKEAPKEAPNEAAKAVEAAQGAAKEPVKEPVKDPVRDSPAVAPKSP